MKASTGFLLLILSLATATCGGSSPSSPSQPPPPPPPPAPPASLVTFMDPATGFSTNDVRDVQEQIVRFDTAGMLVWAANDSRFPGYPVSGNFINQFQVRFGMKDNERRAYFTETSTATICDIEVSGGQLSILPTNVPVPGGS